MIRASQTFLFTELGQTPESLRASSTFVPNMSLPVHRWFRYSAGFSAEWVEALISATKGQRAIRIFDPFAGSGTTLIASECAGIPSCGIEAHPFVGRVARAKLAWRTDPREYRQRVQEIQKRATTLEPEIGRYPKLIRSCYDDRSLAKLDALRQAYETTRDTTPASELAWLTLASILRKVSKAGTAQWQYVLPKKQKRNPADPIEAFEQSAAMIYQDMCLGQEVVGPRAVFHADDARNCASVPKHWANLIITSPPYPNNYDYADATRLEMSFFGEINGWSDLQDTVRKHLIRSCSQHVPEKTANLGALLAARELEPIRHEITPVCQKLAEVRESKGGKKTYHLMIGSYFLDLAKVWVALRRVCDSPSRVCFVVGDSAPYGVYVPVIPWLGRLALAAGFRTFRFEKTRDRNVKWKNRKHRVPLQEGRLWVEG